MRETEPTSPASTACQKARAGPEAARVTMGPGADSGFSADPVLGFSTSLAQRACLSLGGSPRPLHSSGDQLMRTEYVRACGKRSGGSWGWGSEAEGGGGGRKHGQMDGEGLCVPELSLTRPRGSAEAILGSA